MVKKYTVDEILKRACLEAEMNVNTFIDAYNRDATEPAVKESLEYLEALRKYRLKRWGKTHMEVIMDTLSPVKIQDILKR